MVPLFAMTMRRDNALDQEVVVAMQENYEAINSDRLAAQSDVFIEY